MDFPELYRFGREGRWFGMGLFAIYMLDGVMQVRCPSQSLECFVHWVLVCCYLLPDPLRVQPIGIQSSGWI